MLALLANSISLLLSLAVLAANTPVVRLPSVAYIVFYAFVPGYALLGLVDYKVSFLDRVAYMVLISLGLVVGVTSLFQTYYPYGAVNQSLVLPLVSLAALALRIRSDYSRPHGVALQQHREA